MSAFGQITGTVQGRHPASLVLFGLPLAGALLGAVLALAFGQPAADKPHAAAPVGGLGGAVVSAGALPRHAARRLDAGADGPKIPGFDGAHAAFARSYDSDVAIALLPARSAVAAAAGPRRGDHARGARGRASSGRGRSAPTTTCGRPRAGACSTSSSRRPPSGWRRSPARARSSPRRVRPGAARPAPGRRSFLPLSTESAFLAGLPGAVTTLGAQRLRLRTRLTRAGSVAGAARTAYRLAGTYGTAYRALRPLAAPHSEARSTVILLRRLRSRLLHPRRRHPRP
jgi:hypothetical protein